MLNRFTSNLHFVINQVQTISRLAHTAQPIFLLVYTFLRKPVLTLMYQNSADSYTENCCYHRSVFRGKNMINCTQVQIFEGQTLRNILIHHYKVEPKSFLIIFKTNRKTPLKQELNISQSKSSNQY